MKYPNKTKVLGIWTDWNRAGAEGQYGGIGWYRIINPLEKIENVSTIGKITLGTDRKEEIAKEIKSKADVLFIKYVDSFNAVNHLLTIRDVMNIKLVVDIDDNVFKVHPHNYAYKDTHPESEAYRAFQYLFKEADALVCSTQPLADYMKVFNSKVYVIPNSIDTSIWNVPIKKNHGKVKIGWVSGPTHEQDVPVIYPVVKEIIKKYPNVEFNHIGWKSAPFDNLERQKMIFGTQGYKEFPKFLASLGMDILVAPLIDDEFNQGKSNIKWMEAAMCEVPCVCSDVYPYSKSITQGKDGYLASRTSEWIKYLSILIENKEKRVEIGKKAKETVLKKYTSDKFLPKYVEVFEEVTKPDPEITVVVTKRKGESAGMTLESLKKQSYRGIKEIIEVEDKYARGQNWAKNQGLRQVDTEYVLFSDNDIKWKPWAVRKLVKSLEDNKDCSYSYGAYLWNWEKDGKTKVNIACNEPWSAERLKDYKKGNFVSTMSLVRTKDCPEMDENVKRLTDWDLWLSMLPKKGVHCVDIIFETEIKKGGMSCENPYTYEMALEALIKKHNL